MSDVLHSDAVVAVFAHPDDESLGCGGTLARLADSGMRVTVVCASHGERGSPNHPDRDDALARTRANELHEAATTLGISEVILLDYPDGELQWTLVTEFRADLEMFLRRRRPAAVITFGSDGLYWHSDHIGIHEHTTAVVRSLGAGGPSLYYVTMATETMTNIVAAARQRGWMPPAQGFWSLAPEAFGVGAKPPTVVVDVARWVPRKLAAIECHLSQVGVDHPFAQLDNQAACRWLGLEYFHRADDLPSKPSILESFACASRP